MKLKVRDDATDPVVLLQAVSRVLKHHKLSVSADVCDQVGRLYLQKHQAINIMAMRLVRMRESLDTLLAQDNISQSVKFQISKIKAMK